MIPLRFLPLSSNPKRIFFVDTSQLRRAVLAWTASGWSARRRHSWLPRRRLPGDDFIKFTSGNFRKGLQRAGGRTHKVSMLDDKSPRVKFAPPSRGSSFYIENLLGTTGSRSSAEERAETPSCKVAGHGPGMCPGLEARRVSDNDGSDWSGRFPHTATGSSRSESASDSHCCSFAPIERLLKIINYRFRLADL